MEKLNFEALGLAIQQFEKGLLEAMAHPENALMRDGVIQRFEYTMDLSWKMIQRYLRGIQLEESAIRSKNDLFREAARLDLIEDAARWIRHYAARNETSHDYNTEKADRVYAQASLFLPDVKKLWETLARAT